MTLITSRIGYGIRTGLLQIMGAWLSEHASSMNGCPHDRTECAAIRAAYDVLRDGYEKEES